MPRDISTPSSAPAFLRTRLAGLVNRLRDHFREPRLLVSTFSTLFWYFPNSDTFRVVHEGAGRYYGVGLADDERRLLVMSRPDQERDDLLLAVDPLTSECSRRWQLDSRDTHQIVRDGRRLFVTDAFRGRILVYELPDVRLVRRYDNFDYQAHINSIRVLDGDLYALAHNFGPSVLYRLDQESGAILDQWPSFGMGSHDIIAFEGSFLSLDSAAGGLLRVDRRSKRAETLWAQSGMFTKGLCVEGNVAYFGLSRPSQREQRYSVVCSMVAFDIAKGTVLWHRAMPFPGLVNAINTPRQLLVDARGTDP